MCSPISVSEYSDRSRPPLMSSSACENYSANNYYPTNNSNLPQYYHEQQKQPRHNSSWTLPYNFSQPTIPLTHSQLDMEYEGVPLVSLPPVQSHFQIQQHPLMSHSQHAYSGAPEFYTSNDSSNMFPIQAAGYYYHPQFYFPQASPLISDHTVFPAQLNAPEKYKQPNSPL